MRIFYVISVALFFMFVSAPADAWPSQKKYDAYIASLPAEGESPTPEYVQRSALSYFKYNLKDPDSAKYEWGPMARIMLSGRRLDDGCLKTMYQIAPSNMADPSVIRNVNKNGAFEDSLRSKALDKYRSLSPSQAALRIAKWLRNGGDDDLSTALGYWISCPDNLKVTAIDCLGDMIEEALLPDLILEVTAENK
jgi:hypothetical protein